MTAAEVGNHGARGAMTNGQRVGATPDAEPDTVTLLSANLLTGGLGSSRTEDRFEALMHLARQQEADIVCFQECLWFADDNLRLFYRAERLLGMRGVLGRVHTGLHVAVFVKQPLAVTSSSTISGGLWHHGALRVDLAHPRREGPEGTLTVVSAHLSPRSPAQRLLETEQLIEHVPVKGMVLLAMDANTADEHTDLSNAAPRVRAGLALPGTTVPDLRPIQRLGDADFSDAAAILGSVEPTTGHWPGHEVINSRTGSW
ncbi:endonuclease/exonuclease/phosphatase family protein [Streptomyces sp. NPDC013161]|uniref:endonuclease/exonuclease/phosphatase family protein n=1 Tax=Streptomyces sp. NPDC013161 TaxID=3364862 RepID=UPI0036C3FE25